MEKYSIFLRAFEPNDYLLINKWRNDLGIQKLTGGTFRYVSSEREKEWVKEKMMNNTTDIYLAICVNDESQKMIGYTSINNIDYIHRSAFGGGVVIGDREYRDGISLIERCLLLLSYAFDTLNLNRFYGNCLEEHKTSLCLVKSMKYELEGIEKQAIYKDGVYHNRFLFALLREDYYKYLYNGDYELRAIIRRFRDISKDK